VFSQPAVHAVVSSSPPGSLLYRKSMNVVPPFPGTRAPSRTRSGKLSLTPRSRALQFDFKLKSLPHFVVSPLPFFLLVPWRSNRSFPSPPHRHTSLLLGPQRTVSKGRGRSATIG